VSSLRASGRRTGSIADGALAGAAATGVGAAAALAEARPSRSAVVSRELLRFVLVGIGRVETRAGALVTARL